MARITDKQMQAKASATDTWLNEPFARGHGVFLGRITPAGERFFYYRYTQSSGGRVRLPLGAYSQNGKDGLTLAEARDKAQELSRLYRAGAKDLKEHLNTEAEQRKQEAEDAAKAKERRKTFRQVFDQWIKSLKPHTDSNGKRHGRKDSGDATLKHFERRVFNTLGNIPMEEVKKPEVLAILAKVRDEKKMRTANVLLSDLKQMFRFALAWEYIEKDPIATIDKKRDAGGDDVERSRHLSDSELSTLVAQIPDANLAKRTELSIMVLLSTICRIGELTNARWEHVNIEQRNWYIPTSKNQRDHNIYLSDFALKQFKALQDLREKGKDGKLVPWVFPNKGGDGALNIKTLGKQYADRQRPENKKQLKRRTKKNMTLALEGGRWTAHDLRRTGATIMARLKVPSDVIDECLNHIIPRKTSRVYIQDRRMSEQRTAFIKLGARLESLVHGKKLGVLLELAAG